MTGDRPKRTRAEMRADIQERDVEIVRLMSLGWTNVRISRKLFIGESTVRDRVQAMHNRYNVMNRAHLVGEYFRRGLLEPNGGQACEHLGCLRRPKARP